MADTSYVDVLLIATRDSAGVDLFRRGEHFGLYGWPVAAAGV